MATLLHRGLAQVAPTGPVVIDWGHPLAQGLGFVADLRRPGGFDLTGRNPRTLNGALTWSSAGATGWTMSNYLTYGTGSGVTCDLTGQITVAAIATRANPFTDGQLVSRDKDTGGRSYTLDFVTAGKTRFYVNGGGTDILIEPGTRTAGVEFSVLGSWTASRMQLWINGVLVGSKTSGDTLPSATTPLEVGRRAYSGYEGPWTGAIALAAVWQRALPPAQAAWFQAEPYAFFTQGVHRRIFLLGAGVSASPFRPQVLVIG